MNFRMVTLVKHEKKTNISYQKNILKVIVNMKMVLMGKVNIQ